MKAVIVVLTLVFTAFSVRAQTPDPTQIDRAMPTHALKKPSDVFLQVDGHFFGVRLLKDGHEVGPGFMARDLNDAVHGVPVAELHATRARRAAAWALGFGIAALGLSGASLGYQATQDGHDALGITLGATHVAASIGTFIAYRIYATEFMQSVNEYNSTLMRSVESQFE